MNRRVVAKALYWTSCVLQRIRTPRRVYRLVSFDPFTTEPVGWHWLSCRPSMWLLKRSMRLDWDHWDHWALDHTDCNPSLCPGCAGMICEEPS